MIYTVCNGCKEVPGLEYADGLVFYYFNTKGKKGRNSGRISGEILETVKGILISGRRKSLLVSADAQPEGIFYCT